MDPSGERFVRMVNNNCSICMEQAFADNRKELQ